MKPIILSIFLVLLGSNAFSQKFSTATIQTSAECGDCKERIESVLNYTKGVKFAELDIPSKVLTVKYKTATISLDQIRSIVSEIGYDADHVKANPEKVAKLPLCCQPGGMDHK